MKNHPYFADVDWNAVERRTIPPPFIPRVKKNDDWSNFPPEFTSLPVVISPGKENVLSEVCDGDGDGCDHDLGTR